MASGYYSISPSCPGRCSRAWPHLQYAVPERDAQGGAGQNGRQEASHAYNNQRNAMPDPIAATKAATRTSKISVWVSRLSPGRRFRGGSCQGIARCAPHPTPEQCALVPQGRGSPNLGAMPPHRINHLR
jgi:hypothetical protein